MIQAGRCYNEVVFPPSSFLVNRMSHTHKFWPLDYDPEGEIYENVAWDLPGFRRPSRLRENPTHKRSEAKSRDHK